LSDGGEHEVAPVLDACFATNPVNGKARILLKEVRASFSAPFGSPLTALWDVNLFCTQELLRNEQLIARAHVLTDPKPTIGIGPTHENDVANTAMFGRGASLAWPQFRHGLTSS
jgi:hypothetical protein